MSTTMKTQLNNGINMHKQNINTNCGHYGSRTDGNIQVASKMPHQFAHGMQGITESHKVNPTTQKNLNLFKH